MKTLVAAAEPPERPRRRPDPFEVLRERLRRLVAREMDEWLAGSS